ncbi:MAG: enoyl-CoA hydratase-related protein, partial [Candidatus Thorarchaeota archaeon]|nr:enoyl-CoA hydratase-related protein [Candidatus Thorarchaeota archaeon]
TKLATKAGIAIKLAKQSLNNAWEIPLAKNLQYEVDVFCETFDTEDKDEGVDAFLNKRDATFKHK